LIAVQTIDFSTSYGVLYKIDYFPNYRPDQQQQNGQCGHCWCPDADELAAAQGLVVHHHHSANHTAKLPDLCGWLSATALAREEQIDKEIACKVEAEIMGI